MLYFFLWIMKLTEAASHQFKSVLLSVTSIIEDVGIDEAYLDISDEPDINEIIVEKIKTSIYEKTGRSCADTSSMIGSSFPI